MLQGSREHRPGEALMAMWLQHVDIVQVGKSSVIRDNPHEADLEPLVGVRSNAHRTVQCPLHRLKWNALRPIGADYTQENGLGDRKGSDRVRIMARLNASAEIISENLG